MASPTIAEIRAYPLNDVPTSDMSDNTIQGAIDQSLYYITSIKASDATDDEIFAAERELAGYLSYLAYLDRPVQDVAGAMSDGYFTPSTGTEGIPQIKSVSDSRAKERALRQAALMFIDIISKGKMVNGQLKSQIVPFMGLTSSKT